MWMVLGLGNPGAKYARTRHNVGFLVADRLTELDGATCQRKQLGALVETVRIADENAIVAKPNQFMNLSGQAGASLRGFYKLSNDRIVVVHDDLELPFGAVEVKEGGGHAGHNGLRDLQNRLGGNDFLRVRVGIGRPPSGWAVADFVLAPFTTEESTQLDAVVAQAAAAVSSIVAEGGIIASNRKGRKAS